MGNGEGDSLRNLEEGDMREKMGTAVPSTVSSPSRHDQQVMTENITQGTNTVSHRHTLEQTSNTGKADFGIATTVALKATSDTSLINGSDQRIARKPVGSSSADILSSDFRMFLEGSPEISQETRAASNISELASRHSVYAIIEEPDRNINGIPTVQTIARGNDHYEYEGNESALSCLELDNNLRNQDSSAISAEHSRSKYPEKTCATGTRSTLKSSIFTLEDKISLFPPGTFSPNPVRISDNPPPASNGTLATNSNSSAPTTLRARRAAGSIPHTALQSVVEGSISRKPVNDASNLDPSAIGLALFAYSDTQKTPTFGPPSNGDLSYFFRSFHPRHPSAYPRTVVGLGNSYHENVAHSTLEADVDFTLEQKKRSENNKKKEMAKANDIADARAGDDKPDNEGVYDESSRDTSSESRDSDAYATHEIENALCIREARMAYTLIDKPDKGCQTKLELLQNRTNTVLERLWETNRAGWFTKHPNDDRQIFSNNLRCIECDIHCEICGKVCCKYQEMKDIVNNPQTSEQNREVAKAMVREIFNIVPTGYDKTTIDHCSLCRKKCYTDCFGICSTFLCGNCLCIKCNKLPFTRCPHHKDAQPISTEDADNR